MFNDSAVRNGSQNQRGPAYYHNPGIEPLKYITLGDLLNQAAEKCPNMEAIVSYYEQKKVTVSELKNQAERLGAGFLKLGLKPGDKLAVLGVNSVHLCVTVFAAAKAGLVSVMLSPAYRTQELGVALKKVRAKAIVTDHKFKTQDYPGMLAELAPGMSSAPHGQPLSSSQLPDLSFVIVATEEKLPGCYRLADVLHSTTDRTELLSVEKNVDPDDPAFIMFSSGSTGEPKAAIVSHSGTINRSYISGKRMGLGAKEFKGSKTCHQLPYFHIFGISAGITGGLLFDYTVVIPSPIFHLESTISVLQTIKGIRYFNGIPTMFIDICDKLRALLPKSPELREICSRVEAIVVGGSSSSPETIKAIREVFPNASYEMGYGMTETSGAVFETLKNDPIDLKMKCKMHVLDNVEVKIVDQDGKMVPFGAVGETLLRAPTHFLEYWEDEEKTKETRTKSGWLKTGDLMILTEDGYVSIVGRSKDMINRGGEKIYTSEIECFLLEHPEIVNSQVYGVTDKRLGEEVAASVILHKSSTLTESSLKEYCKGKISHYKIPKYVRFVDVYPMTASGKVKKFMLKEAHEKELEK